MLTFSADADDKMGNCTLRWHMTEAWANRLPYGWVKRRENVIGKWLECNIRYASDDIGGFYGYGGWSGDDLLLLISPIREKSFEMFVVDAETIEARFPAFPEKIRYQKADLQAPEQ